ncbi:MAG: PINc/VapC family ATPase [Methanobrevibacter sp.]|jgi:ATPase|nr:PINc/VapC family ATPase [Candidatus Methanoflexus mossambicus]
MFYDDDEEYLKRMVLDTSAVIENSAIEIIEKENLDFPEIIVPEAVVAELEYQANKGRLSGKKGLKNLSALQKLANNGEISIRLTGKRPNNYEIALSKTGEIDAIIRDIAKGELAVLLTSDKILSQVAEASGIPVIYSPQKINPNQKLKIQEFFDDETMSLHLKENVPPMAKKGKPGEIKLVKLSNEPLSFEILEDFVEEIIEKANTDFKTYLEMDLEGATVVQSRDLRISIAKPPFSEGLEITAVRPVADVSLTDYKLSDKLLERLQNSANGILISGSPGAGKSTFAQALAEFYSQHLNKIVKTMESPRDLQLPDEITQYSPLEGSMENTSDLLLLVRPDFTIYDELRKTHDFHIFADMRLAGVGMIGVVHATKPIDAIGRIANRVELGVIPSIVDTNIYIEDGEIRAVYETKMTVKVPSGMKEADLARPVIEVRDFETGELKNEIYTYGEQTIVMDLDLIEDNINDSNSKSKAIKKSSVEKIAEKEILREIKKAVPKSRVNIEIEDENRVEVYIEEKYIPKFIGKGGKKIDKLEKKIGIHIGVNPIDELYDRNEEVVIETNKKFVTLFFNKNAIGNSYELFADKHYLFSATVGKNASVKIKQGMELADALLSAIESNVPIIAKRIE